MQSSPGPFIRWTSRAISRLKGMELFSVCANIPNAIADLFPETLYVDTFKLRQEIQIGSSLVRGLGLCGVCFRGGESESACI